MEIPTSCSEWIVTLTPEPETDGKIVVQHDEPGYGDPSPTPIYDKSLEPLPWRDSFPVWGTYICPDCQGTLDYTDSPGEEAKLEHEIYKLDARLEDMAGRMKAL